MDRKLLSEVTTSKVYSTQGTFATGDTVTIAVYKNGVLETLTSNACVEIGTTGNFYFELSNLDTQPTAYSELFWIMSDNTTKKESGLLVAGGWAELLLSLPANLQAANTCRITASFYEVNGECKTEPAELCNVNKSNYIEVKPSGLIDSRYFEVGQYKPSYDAVTGEAYWILPQGSTIDIKLESFGLSATGKTVPASSTATLDSIINS